MAGRITGLVAQKKNRERVNVYIEGEFAFGLAMIEALKLHKGQVLSAEDIARLKALDEVEVAHEQALNFLSFRPRSASEVRQNLATKQVSEAAIDLVIERLQAAGLVNDGEFARFWVDNRQQFNPRGARALRQELSRKGVPDEVIREALDETDETESAYRAASQRAGRYAGVDRATFYKKLGDFLMRRGYSYPTAREALDRLWQERLDSSEAPEDGYDPNIDNDE
ncbi:MAG: RecX family transcriptional regulator [Anaerolineae bacterium]|nr:RecX family transcriptional regulator [Anaerolineae bacterium]